MKHNKAKPYSAEIVRPPKPISAYVRLEHASSVVHARQAGPDRFDLTIFNPPETPASFGGDSSAGTVNVSLSELRDLLAKCEELAEETKAACES